MLARINAFSSRHFVTSEQAEELNKCMEKLTLTMTGLLTTERLKGRSEQSSLSLAAGSGHSISAAAAPRAAASPSVTAPAEAAAAPSIKDLIARFNRK